MSFKWAGAVLGYLPVLAVDALEVAVGKKDVADTLGAGQGRFLAPVDADSGDFGLPPGMAETLSDSTVDTAGPGTEATFHVAKIRIFR